MLDSTTITMAVAIMPLFVATYYFGKLNGNEETLHAVLSVLMKEGIITDDEDISSESNQD